PLSGCDILTSLQLALADSPTLWTVRAFTHAALDCTSQQEMETPVSIDLQGKRVAFLGAGKMGGILLKALLSKKLLSPQTTVATVAHEDRACTLKEKLGITVGTDNRNAIKGANIIFVCVKPQVVQEVMEQIRPELDADQLVISVAASVHTRQIEDAV